MKAILLSFLIPALLAALSGMGIGGGGLFVLYLKFFGGIGQLHTQALNLVFFIFAAGVSLIIHFSRRRIYFGAVALMISCGIIGSLLGSAVAIRINGSLLGKMFGLMLIFAGIYSFFSRRAKKGKQKEIDTQDTTNCA